MPSADSWRRSSSSVRRSRRLTCIALEPHGLGDLGLGHVAPEPQLDELLVAGRQALERGAHDDALVERRVGPGVAAGVEQVEHGPTAVGRRGVEGGRAQVGRRDLGLLDGLEA